MTCKQQKNSPNLVFILFFFAGEFGAVCGECAIQFMLNETLQCLRCGKSVAFANKGYDCMVIYYNSTSVFFSVFLSFSSFSVFFHSSFLPFFLSSFLSFFLFFSLFSAFFLPLFSCFFFPLLQHLLFLPPSIIISHFFHGRIMLPGWTLKKYVACAIIWRRVFLIKPSSWESWFVMFFVFHLSILLSVILLSWSFRLSNAYYNT